MDPGKREGLGRGDSFLRCWRWLMIGVGMDRVEVGQKGSVVRPVEFPENGSRK